MQDYDVWAILGGEGSFIAPEGTFQLRAGDVFILRPHGHYTGIHDPAHPLVVIFVHFSYLDFENKEIYPGEPQLPAFHRYIENMNFPVSLLERAMHSCPSFVNRTGEKDARLQEANIWLSAFLHEIQRIDRRMQLSSGENSRYSEISRLCEKIIRDPGRDWRIVDMAKNLHYSKDHFIRIFRKYCGLTPNEFILQTRMEAARNHLRLSNLSVGQIARILGYRDFSFFTRQFKKRTGQSPSSFRSSQLE